MKIQEAINKYLHDMALARSKTTARCYGQGLKRFCHALRGHGIDPDQTDISGLNEYAITWLIEYCKGISPATERLYTYGAISFFYYLAAEELAPINLERAKLLVKQRARRAGIRIPQLDRQKVEAIIKYAEQLKPKRAKGGMKIYHAELESWRNRALILTLADTGLRIFEACGLLVSDIDFEKQRAVIIGKGDKMAVVRFSGRAINAIREYLNARAELDALYRRIYDRDDIYLFSRHDFGAGTRVKSITTATGRNIVANMARAALGPEAVYFISPHSFRHYFCTVALDKSGGNLMLVKELARHELITTTARYCHLSNADLDRKYQAIFEKELK